MFVSSVAAEIVVDSCCVLFLVWAFFISQSNVSNFRPAIFQFRNSFVILNFNEAELKFNVKVDAPKF